MATIQMQEQEQMKPAPGKFVRSRVIVARQSRTAIVRDRLIDNSPLSFEPESEGYDPYDHTPVEPRFPDTGILP